MAMENERECVVRSFVHSFFGWFFRSPLIARGAQCVQTGKQALTLQGELHVRRGRLSRALRWALAPENGTEQSAGS